MPFHMALILQAVHNSPPPPPSSCSSSFFPRPNIQAIFYCIRVHIYFYLKSFLLPHKEDGQVHSPRLCPLQTFFHPAIFRNTPAWATCSSNLHFACTDVLSQPSHELKFIFFLSCQLVIRKPSCDHGCDLVEGEKYSVEYCMDMAHLIIQLVSSL